MGIGQVIILALVQGVTEFVPISSSGHLVLIREWLGWSHEHGLLLDIMLHTASLLAIVVYFRAEWVRVIQSFIHRDDEGGRYYRSLPGWLMLATLPIALVGPGMAKTLEASRTAVVVGAIMVATALWFVWCERQGRRRETSMSWVTALCMGVAQIAALFPGGSRSGITTGAGLWCGLQREDAAKFSFFMAIPAILGALVFKMPELLEATHHGLSWSVLGVGFGVCFVVSMVSIHLCLVLYRRHSLGIFAIYLACLGLGLLIGQ